MIFASLFSILMDFMDGGDDEFGDEIARSIECLLSTDQEAWTLKAASLVNERRGVHLRFNKGKSSYRSISLTVFGDRIHLSRATAIRIGEAIEAYVAYRQVLALGQGKAHIEAVVKQSANQKNPFSVYPDMNGWKVYDSRYYRYVSISKHDDFDIAYARAIELLSVPPDVGDRVRVKIPKANDFGSRGPEITMRMLRGQRLDDEECQWIIDRMIAQIERWQPWEQREFHMTMQAVRLPSPQTSRPERPKEVFVKK